MKVILDTSKILIHQEDEDFRLFFIKLDIILDKNKAKCLHFTNMFHMDLETKQTNHILVYIYISDLVVIGLLVHNV